MNVHLVRGSCLLLALLAGCLSLVPREPTMLVEEQQGRAVIVVAADAAPEIERAAEELQALLRRASGAELPLVRPADLEHYPETGRVFLGAAFADRFPRADLSRCRADGAVVAAAGKDLLIAGPTPTGTEFGVYGFLQDHVGVRWYLPGPHGTHVPKRPTVSVPGDCLRLDNPAFLSRAYSAPTFWEDAPFFQPAKEMDQAWYRHNRMLPRLHCSHNLGRIIVPSVYGQDHPEYFPWRDGERRVPDSDRPVGFQPCMTNPDVIELCAQAAAEYFDEHPGTLDLSFSIGVNDHGGYCECVDCTAANGGPPQPNSRGLPNFSQLAFQFGNRVAALLPERHRDKYVGMLAYANIRDYPEGQEIHPNLAVQRVAAFVCYFNADDRRDMADTARFARECGMFSVYDYFYGGNYSIPVMPLGLLDEYIDFLAARDTRGWNSETYQNWAMDGIKYHLLARKLWNPELHLDDLLAEYCDNMFGAGAPAMLAFYRRCRERWESQEGPTTKYHLNGSVKQVLVFDTPTCERLLGLLDAARTACGNADGRALIEYQTTAMQQVAANARKVRAEQQLCAAEDIDDLARLTLAALVQAEAVDAARAALRRDAFCLHRGKLPAPLGMEPGALATPLWQRCRKDGRGDLWTAFVDAVRERAPTHAARVAWLATLPQTDDLPELLANADLRNGTPDSRQIADWTVMDWGSADVESDIRLRVGDDGVPFSDLRGLAHCFMYAPSPGIDQFVDLEPDRWYLCRFETRAAGDLVAPTATVYLPRAVTACPVTPGRRWVPVAWTFKTPAKTGSTRIRFAMNGLGEAAFRKLSLKALPADLAPPPAAETVEYVMPPLEPPAELPPPTVIDFARALPPMLRSYEDRVHDGMLIADDGYAVLTVFHDYTGAYDLEIEIEAGAAAGATLGLAAIPEVGSRRLGRESLCWNRQLEEAPQTLSFPCRYVDDAHRLRLIVYRANREGTLRVGRIRLKPLFRSK